MTARVTHEPVRLRVLHTCATHDARDGTVMECWADEPGVEVLS